MKTLASLFFLCCSALWLTGCPSTETARSRDVAQTEIYQDYTVNYNGSMMSAAATFRFGGPQGTTLMLTNPSQVRYNGQPMTPEQALFGGAYYRFSNMAYQSQNRFDFTDAQGRTYTNNLTLLPLDCGPAPARSRRTANITLSLSRPPDTEETVEVTLTDSKNQDFTSVAYSTPASVMYRAAAQRLTMTPEFLKTATSGPATLKLKVSRTQNPLPQATHLGGKLTVVYEATELNLNLSK